MPASEMLTIIQQKYGAPEPITGRGDSPAQRYRLPDGGSFGLIASNTEPFCGACSRGRLTADGMWYRCLHAVEGLDLKTPLRAGQSDEQLRALVSVGWRARRDRGAEERAGRDGESASATKAELSEDSHLEMHTRGG